MPTSIVWFRRDLRLHDHPALTAAAANGAVLPVYIHAPDEEAPWAPGGASRWWLHHSLAALARGLAEHGLPLLIRRGDSLSELRRIARETGATAVHWSRLYEPASKARDGNIKAALREDGLDAHSHNAALLREPWTIATGDGAPYRVYTPYSRKLLGTLDYPEVLPVPPLRAPETVPTGEKLEALELLPRLDWDRQGPDGGMTGVWTPGEDGALTALGDFFDEAAQDYSAHRDLPALRGTSRLSPHLHFGEVSPRQALVLARAEMQARQTPGARAGLEHFLRELVWREFAHHLLHHYPHTTSEPMNPRFEAFPWRAPRDYADDLAAFREGRTGIPIVDAGMRELWANGWMHNRVRMVVGSFLTKNLLIPWQEGAAWFWDTLLDADLANNSLGWQWIAGCGADAAPYFRIFNPVLQSRKFDAQGNYLRHWIPELRGLPDKLLHAPWEAAPEALAAAGVRLGGGYPRPIVDLAATRSRALAAYARI